MLEPKPRPTVGRVVHYVIGNEVVSHHVAAIVTAVLDDESVLLTLFEPQCVPLPLDESVAHYEEPKSPGTWHWPERE